MKFNSIKEIANYLSQCFGEDMTFYECDTRTIFMLNSPQNTASFAFQTKLNYNLAGQMGINSEFVFNGSDTVVATSTSTVSGRRFKTISTLIKNDTGLYFMNTFSEYLLFVYTNNVAKIKGTAAWNEAVNRYNVPNASDAEIIRYMASAYYTIINDVPAVLPTNVSGKLTYDNGTVSATLTISGVNVTPVLTRWWFEPTADSVLAGQPTQQKNATGDYQGGRTSWKIDNDFRNRAADTVIIPNRKFVAKCQLTYKDSPTSTNYVMAELLIDTQKEPFKFFV
jgi:hypothetical protein